MDKYTANDFRNAASYVETYDVFEDHDREIAEMLRQAADIMERDEREKKYEYAKVLSDGSISCTHFDEYAKGCYKFRREVGEWEEVK